MGHAQCYFCGFAIIRRSFSINSIGYLLSRLWFYIFVIIYCKTQRQGIKKHLIRAKGGRDWNVVALNLGPGSQ